MIFTVVFLSLLSFLAEAEDDCHQKEEKLYAMLCRDPTPLIMPIEDLTVPFFNPSDLIPDQKTLIKKCWSKYGWCPTMKHSKCISVPGTEKQKKIEFQLKNGTNSSLIIEEDTMCSCAC